MTYTTPAASTSPVVEDLSAFVVSGRLQSQLPEEVEFETSVRTPAQGLDDGVEAEKIGFRRVFLAERPDLKEASTILAGIAARTTRLGVASGIVAAGSRHPMLMASLGTTMQAAYGPRFTLGIGRGAPAYGHGGHMTMTGFADTCTIIKRLWAGEQFEYSGPAGDLGRLGLRDIYDGPAPDIIAGLFALPLGAKKVAETPAIDGVLLPAMLTPTGAGRAVKNIREACERAGRDPQSVRVLAEVVTAPELSEAETFQLAHARAVTYLQPPAWGAAYPLLNGWDPRVLERLRQHPQFTGLGNDDLADLKYHRVELLEPAKVLPHEWIEDACALGSIDNCVRKLQEFRDAGVDEITTYGSTPGQNAKLVEAWRVRAEARKVGAA